MHKSSNESLIKALYIIADEVETFGGFTQSTALREAATRIEDLSSQSSQSTLRNLQEALDSNSMKLTIFGDQIILAKDLRDGGSHTAWLKTVDQVVEELL